MPTKSSKTVEVGQVDRTERRRRAAQSIKRFRPISGARIALPSPEGITYAHAPIYTSIAKVEVDAAWTHFASHLNDLSNNKAEPLGSNLFDALFWLIAAENITSRQRQEQVFGRVEILHMYASSQANYGLTRLQLHRTVYIWTSLWERFEVQAVSFPQIKFKETVCKCLNDLDRRLASRVFSRMLNSCKTPDDISDVSESIKEWLQVGHCKDTRQENWASTSALESPNDKIYFNQEHRGRLDGQMWEDLLEKCFQIGFSAKTISAGMLALRQPELDPSLDYVSQILAFLDSNRLYNLLPIDVQVGAAAIDYTIQLPPSSEEDVTFNKEEDAVFTEDDKKRLVYAVAFVLATRQHYSAALYLYKADKQNLEKGTFSAKKVETYTAVANACARLASLGPPRTDPSLRDAKWTLVQLQRNLRLLKDCDWHESRARNITAKLIIKALWNCIVLNQSIANVQSPAQWLLLLRQFTTILLTHDPDLASLHVGENIISYSQLIRLHILHQDYPFAKRLFLLRSTQDRHDKSFIFQSEFLWLFEQSLEKEDDSRFASQLFLYWTSLDENNSTAMPPGLLRMYFWKLKDTKGGRVGIRMLRDHFDVENLSAKKQLRRPNQAFRMMRTYFGVDIVSIDLSLDMAEDLLEFWKQERENHLTVLVVLYSIAMQGSTKRIYVLDAILRSRITKLFTSFQQHFSSLSIQRRQSIGTKCRDYIQGIYACAIKVVIEDEQTTTVYKKVERLIEELQDYWKIKYYSSQLWTLRIQARLVDKDADNVDQARSLYLDALQALDERKGLIKEQGILPASITAKLMMALGKKGKYKEAIDLISVYQNAAGPLTSSSAVLIEGAHIAILHMQGHVGEALQRLKVLKMQGDELSSGIEGARGKIDERWRELVNKATDGLEEQIKSQQVDQHREVKQGEEVPAAISEEEQEREKMFRAMAGGQPWTRR